MKAGKIISSLLWLFVIAPIWYYLLYKILIAVNASELMWFLYWIYIPAAILSGIISKVAELNDTDTKVDVTERKTSRFQEKLDAAMENKK